MLCDILPFLRILCKEGKLKEALQMVNCPDRWPAHTYLEIFVCIFQGCTELKAIFHGRLAHANLVRSTLEPNIFMWNVLINMYAKCGSLKEAMQVFDNMDTRNVFTWTILIAGYVQMGNDKGALNLYTQMKQNGMRANKVTLLSVMKACRGLASMERGKYAHADALTGNYESDYFIGNTLVDMYCKYGSVEDAYSVFKRLPEQNVVSWSALIGGCVQCNEGVIALKFYFQMQREFVKPDKVIFLSVLAACVAVLTINVGKLVHTNIIQAGYLSNISISNSLIDMYAKCGSIDDALKVFNELSDKDIVSWNAIIAAYVQYGFHREPLDLFNKMPCEGLQPDKVTFVSVLKSCAFMMALEEGKWIHSKILKTNFQSDVFVGNTLVDFYTKCVSVKTAWQVFERLPKLDLVSWNAMIAGYAQHGSGKETHYLLQGLEMEGLQPDKATFLNALSGCAVIPCLKKLHARVIVYDYAFEASVGNALADMYVKCGCIHEVCQVFEWLPRQDIVSWTMLVVGSAQQGNGHIVVKLLKEIQLEGIKLDSYVFAIALSCCSHLCIVDEGFHYFCLLRHHALTPSLQHYASVVDLLSRAAYLNEAEDLIDSLPFDSNADVWMTLLGACKIPRHEHRIGG